MLRAVLLLAGLALVACGERPVVEVPVTHPANTNAAEAPVPAASTTLGLPAHDQPSPGFDVPRRQIDQPLGQTDRIPDGAGEHQAKPAGSSAGPAGEHAGMNMKSGAMPKADKADEAQQQSGSGGDPSTGKKTKEATAETSGQVAAPEHVHDDIKSPDKAPHADGVHAGHGQTSEASAGQASDTGMWTCSMHPEVVSAKPGRCQKCNMKLIPKKNEMKDEMKKDDKP